MTAIRIYVFLGQFDGTFSAGMYTLATELRAVSPKIICTVHGWTGGQAVADDIGKEAADTKIVVMGFSLGANTCTQVAAAVKRSIALLVAYDASILQVGGIKAIGKNVERTICVRSVNYWLPFGHGQLVGHNVETVTTGDIHVGIPNDVHLRMIGEIAVRRLLAA